MMAETICCVDGFHHVALRVADFDAVVAFYRDGLGLEETIAWGEGDERAVMLHLGRGNYLEIFAGGGETTEGENVAVLHVALRTGDAEAALARAVAAGAEVTVPLKELTIPSRPQPTPVRLAFCKGPAGEIIEFFENETT